MCGMNEVSKEVLRLLIRSERGRYISSLSKRSKRSIAAVREAIKRLESEGYIRVDRSGFRLHITPLLDDKTLDYLIAYPEYQREIMANRQLATWVTDVYGPRCRDVDPDCLVCNAWKLYDQLKVFPLPIQGGIHGIRTRKNTARH